MIVSHVHENKCYVFSNDDLEVGDKVFPISNGLTIDGKYTHKEFDYRDFMCGFPDGPHIIKNLHYSDYKPYEIYTSHGFGPVEKYFKIISINNLE